MTATTTAAPIARSGISYVEKKPQRGEWGGMREGIIGRQIKILLACEYRDDAESRQKVLAKFAMETPNLDSIRCDIALSATEVRQLIKTTHYDLVVLDRSISPRPRAKSKDGQGFALMPSIRRSNPSVKIAGPELMGIKECSKLDHPFGFMDSGMELHAAVDEIARGIAKGYGDGKVR